MQYSYAATLALLVSVTAYGQPPAPSLALDPVPFDDVSELLRVLRRSGRLTLPEDAPKGRIVAEFYAAGKLARGELDTGLGYDATRDPRPKREVRFVAQFADLDYLPLGDAKKGHVRMLLKLRVGDDVLTTSSTQDIPKTVFDYTKGIGGGEFPAKAATAAEVPLFYLVANSNQIKASSTPKEAVELHPDAQVAIFYFRRPSAK
ncbi:hypothetical protein GobsT_61780 [Gemmata obscuriglobus]|uniref:TIGR03435 family protein n=1 Tax=Gemmata obscuriglobus TaxID=114 RepID=A0A2Z3GXC8_9BACT|nr:hypothetical protein [Gemmata obscuriglobus]AWM36066.1 hypothetical protein C1280_02940 [Gemmata obscuriglobus]QEG31357.1 hypothetical protein GobsT_61780 [Gemmata obscuriglobus]VTS10697.1 unnamed protein product [Gemmata obscuriglobus UQM 2246]